MTDHTGVREFLRTMAEEVTLPPIEPRGAVRRAKRRLVRILIGTTLAVAVLAAATILGVGRLVGDRSLPTQRPAHQPSGTPNIGGLPPTPSRLAGIWLNDGGPSPGWGTLLFRFSSDGTFAVDAEGMLDTSPAFQGTYLLDGNTMTFTPGPGSSCGVEGSWAWRAAVPQPGRLHIVLIADDTASLSCDKAGVGTEWTFTRVSPVSPTNLHFPPPAGTAIPPPDAAGLRGIWFLTRTDTLVRLGTDGTYAMDNRGRLDTAPSDVGTFQVDGGTITFTSGAQSRGCDQGDRWVWKKVKLGVEDATLRAVTSKDECKNRAGPTQILADVNVHELSGLLAST